MPTSRRDLLKGALGGSVFLLGGCAGEGIRYPLAETPTQESKQQAVGDSEENVRTETVSDAQGEQEADVRYEEHTVDNPRLYADTDDVFTEIEWFASTYSSAIVRAASRARAVNQTLIAERENARQGGEDIGRVETVTDDYHDFLSSTFGPHFPPLKTQRIVSKSREHVRFIREFAEKNDRGALDTEFERLISYYSRLGTASVLRSTFPGLPINSPLAEYLTADDASEAAFVVGYPGENFTSVVHSSDVEPETQSVSALSERDMASYFRKQTGLFRGVDTGQGRTGRAFVHIHSGDAELDVRHTPVYIQQFLNSSSARQAYETLLGSTVSADRSVDIGRTNWSQVHHSRVVKCIFRTYNGKYTVYDSDGQLLYQEIMPPASRRGSPKIVPDVGTILHDSDGNVVYDADGRVARYTSPQPRTIVSERMGSTKQVAVYMYLTRVGEYIIAAAPSLTVWERRDDDALAPLRESWLA